MAEFDVARYLRKLDPEVSYSVQPVNGGVVNVTARAVKSPDDAHKGRFPGYSSVIVKYAPPYIAKIGKDAPFSQFRQTIEARALSLLTQESLSGLARIAVQSKVSIPPLLHHDPEAHVLVIVDLGSFPDLSDIFNELGGYHPMLEPVEYDLDVFRSHDLFPEHFEYFKDIGARIGAFFARLHGYETKESIPDRQVFQNSDAKTMVLDHAVRPVVQQVAEFLAPGHEDEAATLGDILIKDASRELSEEEKSFVLGDCWTSAVLVSPHDLYASPVVGIIDWEFAGIGRGSHGDIAQLMAHLEMLRVCAVQHSKFTTHLKALNALVAALTCAYSPQPTQRPKSNALEATKMRSAFIACGTEMINCALWKRWTCTISSCVQPDGSHVEPKSCAIVRNIMSEGVQLLRLARGNTTEFCSDPNWADIERLGQSKSRNGEKWLIDLF